jgi:hypothetical protein
MESPGETATLSPEKQPARLQADSGSKKQSLEDRQKARQEREKENEVADSFAYFDRKRQGKLPLSSLEDVTSMLGITLPPGDKRAPLLKLADPAGNGMSPGSGSFTLAGLKNLIREMQGVTTSEEDIVTTYRLFDRQGKGYFDKKELQAVLERFTGGKVGDKELSQIMAMGQGRKGSESHSEPVISKEVFVSLFN